MQTAPRNQTGLALGAWGAVQATAAGVAVALGGIIRDVIAAVVPGYRPEQGVGYTAVYSLEVILLVATLITMLPLLRRREAAAAASLVHS